MAKFGIDGSREFSALQIAVMTVSDTRTFDTDTSGQILADRVSEAGHTPIDRAIVTDDIIKIRQLASDWISRSDVDVILTTGGTGLTGRDVTVDAIKPLFEKDIDGFSVLFHTASFETVGLSTLQSRACAGLAKGTFIFCLPGSNGAVKDGWDRIIRDQLDRRYRPCNLVDLMPRLNER